VKAQQLITLLFARFGSDSAANPTTSDFTITTPVLKKKNITCYKNVLCY
jgi:hypothetical protein